MLTTKQLEELAEWANCDLCDVALANDTDGSYSINFHRNGHKENK